LASPITRERAERIARAHACERCGEYSFKKLVVKPASASLRDELNAVWVATKICGVCGLNQELGLDEDGDVVFVN
jgi:transcription elongation factor Elf1